MSIVAIIVGASLLRSFGYYTHDIYWIQEDLGGDKIVHCLMGMGLMFSGLLMMVPHTLRSLRRVTISVIGILVAEEASQLLMKTREADVFDLAMGLLGASIVAAMYFVVLLRRAL